LFIIFIEHQFKKVLKQFFYSSFLIMIMHCTFNLFGRKKKKKWPNNWKGKNMNTLHKIEC
jgi:hypothetical protein